MAANCGVRDTVIRHIDPDRREADPRYRPNTCKTKPLIGRDSMPKHSARPRTLA